MSFHIYHQHFYVSSIKISLPPSPDLKILKFFIFIFYCDFFYFILYCRRCVLFLLLNTNEIWLQKSWFQKSGNLKNWEMKDTSTSFFILQNYRTKKISIHLRIKNFEIERVRLADHGIAHTLLNRTINTFILSAQRKEDEDLAE